MMRKKTGGCIYAHYCWWFKLLRKCVMYSEATLFRLVWGAQRTPTIFGVRPFGDIPLQLDWTLRSPTNMEVHKAPAQEQSRLSAGIAGTCALEC